MNETGAEPRAAFGRVALAYAVALGVGLAVGFLLRDRHPIWIAFAADAAATVAIYAFSVAHRNSSFYDPYWSVAPIPIALYWIAAAEGTDGARAVVSFLLVCAWGARLTFNWARGWKGLGHEDWRYVDLRAKTGRLFPLVDFGGIHFMPTALVFLGCLSLWPAVGVGARPWGALDWLATLVTAGAIAIEATADQQLRRFVLSKPPKGSTLTTGLWRYSRHPNYFGENGFWWGLWLFGLAADPSYWWTVAGPLAITLLFVFVSVPLIDARMLERRPDYAARMERVSAIVPLPPKG